MANRTEESKRKLDELIRDFASDGLSPEQLNEPIARVLESLKDESSLKEARFLERVRAYAYLFDKRRVLEGKPTDISEHRKLSEYSDAELDKQIKELQEQLKQEHDTDPDKTLH